MFKFSTGKYASAKNPQRRYLTLAQHGNGIKTIIKIERRGAHLITHIMTSKYIPPSMRKTEESTPKPILVVVEPSTQIRADKYVPPNKRETNPMVGFSGPISALITGASFPSLGASSSLNTPPSAIAPSMNYLQKIRDAEAAREIEDDTSNEALERDGWRILSLSFTNVKERVASWYDTVFYEQTLPF